MRKKLPRIFQKGLYGFAIYLPIQFNKKFIFLPFIFIHPRKIMRKCNFMKLAVNFTFFDSKDLLFQVLPSTINLMDFLDI